MWEYCNESPLVCNGWRSLKYSPDYSVEVTVECPECWPVVCREGGTALHHHAVKLSPCPSHSGLVHGEEEVVEEVECKEERCCGQDVAAMKHRYLQLP